MSRLIQLLFIGFVASTFSGCAYQHLKHSAEYAPVRAPVVLKSSQENGAIFKSETSLSLFESIKAKRVGDILTIVFDEKHEAKKITSTTTDKTTKLNLINPTILGQTAATASGLFGAVLKGLNNNVESTTEFEGTGQTKQRDSLTGKISVTVIEVLSNNNLVIRGEKLLTLNQGDEYVRLSGIVRSIDIEPDNSIVSSKIANAQISYSGKGTTHNSNAPGWFSRFMLSDQSPL